MASGATLTLTGGGMITGGYSSGSGGGVLMGEGSTLTLGDVLITNNLAVGNGDGVYVPEGATLKVCGNPRVKGNETEASDASTVDSNVFLGKDTTIVVDGALTSEACIDVTTYQKPKTGEPVVITQGFDGKGSVASFRSDDRACKVGQSSGEATLSTGVVVTFDSAGGSAVPDQRVAEGLPAEEPNPTPVKYDTRRVWVDNLNGSFTFKGWFVDEACTQPWDFSTPVEHNMTLHAKWCVRYTFDNTGGKPPVSGDPTHPMEYDAIDKLYYIELEVGQSIPAPTAESLNPGMELEGWVYKTWRDDQTGRLYDFDTPASSSVAFTARWRKQTEPPHTVWFSPRNGSSDIPSTMVAHGQPIALVQIPEITREGYDLEGWYTNDFYTDKWDFSTDTVTSDLTLYANWVPQTHVVKFVDDDGVTPLADEQSVAYGEQATRPSSDPEKNGYRFSGWHAPGDRDGYSYQFTRPVYEDLTLIAMWTQLHTVTLDANGGAVSPESYVVRHGRWISHEYEISDLPTPTRDGYLFKGWYYRVVDESAQGWHYGSRYSVSYPVNEDITVIAMWEPESVPDPEPTETKTWRVVFDSMGGTPVDTQTVEDGQCASEPASPSGLDGFVFDRWYADGQVSAYDFKTPVTEDLVLRAGWMPVECSVTYVTGNENGAEPYVEKLAYGFCTSWPNEEPTRGGYTFKHWVKSGKTVPYDFTLPVTESMTLNAVWAKLHKVTFDSQGGSGVDLQEVEDGQTVAEPDDPTREGYVFRCWYQDDSAVPYSFATPMAEDMGDITLHAAWDEAPIAFNVVFDSAGGTPVDSQRVSAGETVEPPLDPTREGYRFAGWYLNDEDEPYDFSTAVSRDLALVAHWVEQQTTTHEVTFDLDWEAPSAIDPQTIHDGGVATRPANPAREGYDFVGWYELLADVEVSQEELDALSDVLWIDHKDDGDHILLLYDFDMPVTSDVSLRARWQVKRHTVTFDTQGGSELSPLEVDHGDSLASLGDPAKKGCSFDGWSTDQEGENSYDLATPVTDDLLLYAQWKDNEFFTVDFDANGGVGVSSQEVPYYGLAIEPDAPTREGYEFSGWWEVLPEGYITREQAEELMDDDPAIADSICFDDDRDGKTLCRYSFAMPVTHDLELRAQWEPLVKFMSGSELIDEQIVAWGERATSPQDPYRYGCVFVGWCTDEELVMPYDLNTSRVTQDMILYARFTDVIYTVSFDSAGGSAVGEQTVTYGGYVSKPADPVREGYVFLGWYEDGADEPFDFQGMQIWNDVTLFARWNKVDKLSPYPDEPAYGVHTSIVNGAGAPMVSQRKGSFDSVAKTMYAAEAAQQDVYVTLTSSALDQSGLSVVERSAIQARLNTLGARVGVWFDLSLAKRLGSDHASPSAISATDLPLKLRVAVPEGLRRGDAGTGRTFYVLRMHNGSVDVLASGAGSNLDMESDRFSTYVLAYADKVQTTSTTATGTTTATTSGNTSGTTVYTTSRQLTPATGDGMSVTSCLVLSALGSLLFACGRYAKRGE